MKQSTEITKSDEKWYTLQELADGCDVNVTAVRRWFRGIRTAVIDSLGLNEAAVIDSLGLTVWFREKSRNGQPVYVVDEVGKACLISWLARNQLSQGKNSSVGAAAVEYVTKSAFDELAAKINLVLEDNRVLREENQQLRAKIDQLIEAPKTVALPSGQSVHPLKAVLPLESFCKYMGVPTPVLLSKKSPLTGGKSINDFPLATLEHFLSYVSYVLEEGFSSAERYSWLQSHPKAAQKLGYN